MTARCIELRSILGELSLSSALLGLSTQLPRLLLFKPALLPLDVSNLAILLALGKEVDPMLQALLHLCLGSFELSLF